MTIDELVGRLRRPMYTLNMTMHQENLPTLDPKGRSARTRAQNARAEIREIVTEFVRENGIMTPDEKEFAEFLGEANEG